MKWAFHKIVRLLEWLGSHSLIVLLAGLVVVVGLLGFIKLADEVTEGETQKFDEWVMHAVEHWHGSGYGGLEEVGRDITALGGITVLSLFILTVAGFLLIIRKYGAMVLMLVASGGGLALGMALKAMFERPRPQIFEHGSYTMTTSFPSGHAMMSATVYLTLGALLARVVAGKVLKLYFIAIALFLTFIVGLSRIYMGVHWPTDVLAGWTAGLVWAILCWLVARALQRRGAVESDSELATSSESSEIPFEKDSRSL